MLEWMHRVLGGSSPITGYLGSIIMVLDVVQQVLHDTPIPQDALGWLAFAGTFLTGLALRFAKDHNRTNAGNPVETKAVT